MPLASGTRLGRYQILNPLGAGGMGEVYRAHDTRLDRLVAIKILPAELSRDPERRARFEREARAVAALNHPHICTLYDVSHHEEVEFLVMELLDGETLAARLKRGRLQIPEVLSCASEIADALDKAHGLGIVHRDLKPANVMLTRSGAKLLDFGLAKLRAEETPTAGAPTQTTPLTGHGQILGTLHYMAPEQLEGASVDARADLFALGTIVYEMVTGRRAFDGSSQAGLIGAILHATPPLMTRTMPDAPPALERLVAVCLSKDPEDRWSTAHDVLLQLRGIDEISPAAPRASVARSRTRERIAWSAAAAAALAALALAAVVLARRAQTPDVTLDLVSVLPPPQTTLASNEAPQISPDGRQVAFVARDRAGANWLFVRSRDSLAARLLPDTKEATLPFWSPDSRTLGFFTEGQLKTIAISGGSPRAIARAPVPRGGSWSRDDVILFSAQPNEPPYRVPASGGQATPVPVGSGVVGFRAFPSFLPDGHHYLYSELSVRTHTAFNIRVASLDSVDTKELIESRGSAAYARGYLLFLRETTLMAQPFDVRTLQLGGTPTATVENVGFNAITYQALFSVSTDDVLAYETSTPGSQLVWFDRHGQRVGTAGPPGDYNTVCLTADDKRIVYDLADPVSGAVDLWTADIAGARPSRVTFDPAVDFYPVCSPAGDEAIFASIRAGPPNLFRLQLTAPGGEKAIVQSPLPKIATDWSRDGKLVVYSVLHPKTNWDVAVAPISGGPSITALATQAAEFGGRLSPNGRWLTYVSNESGTFEVYVQPFPATGAKWQISKGGGFQPQWRRDGAELYYVTPDKTLIGVEVRTGLSDFAVGAATPLVETRITGWERIPLGSEYAAPADGQRFLVSTATDAVLPITLGLNWAAALRR